VEFVELDALFWGAAWTPAEPAVFRARVEAAIAGPAWVVAGNYGAVRDLLWARADTIVWLDYSLPLVLGRLTARTLRRAITREMLWNGNRENLWEHAMLWWSGRSSTGSSRPTGVTAATCRASSPSPPTPTSGSSTFARPGPRRRGSRG
jgi:adenylate kinase family enzyme